MAPQLDILTFHRIMPRGQEYFIPPMAMDESTFSKLIERLAMAKRLVSLDEGVRLLKDGKLQGNKVAISFDDGYLDNYTLGRKIMQRIGAPATFFVPVAPIDRQTPYWWDHLYDVILRRTEDLLTWGLARRFPQTVHRAFETIYAASACSLGERCRVLVQALNALGETERKAFLCDFEQEFGPCATEGLLMNWDDVQQLQREGFAIGSHSVAHIPLTDLDKEAARREIVESSELISQRIGKRPTGFCFPRGAYSSEHARMVADAGYDYAVTTHFGSNTPGADPYTLKRRNMSDYRGVRALFPVAMHLLELTGRFDDLLASRRTA